MQYEMSTFFLMEHKQTCRASWGRWQGAVWAVWVVMAMVLHPKLGRSCSAWVQDEEHVSWICNGKVVNGMNDMNYE